MLTEERAAEIALKRETLTRMALFRIKSGPGSFGKIAKASGGRLQAATLCELLDCKPMPLEKWRLLKRALDKLERAEQKREDTHQSAAPTASLKGSL